MRVQFIVSRDVLRLSDRLTARVTNEAGKSLQKYIDLPREPTTVATAKASLEALGIQIDIMARELSVPVGELSKPPAEDPPTSPSTTEPK